MPGPRVKHGTTRVQRTLRDYLRMQKNLVSKQQKIDMEVTFTALAALNEFTDELYKEGRVMGAADLSKLKKLYEDAIKETEKVMPPKDKAEADYTITEKLSRNTLDMLRQDYQMLGNLRTDMLETGIAEVLSNARGRIVTLVDESGRMGGNQSSRIPMKVPNATGGFTKGVFTPTSEFFALDDWRNKVLEALKVRYPVYAAEIEEFRQTGAMNVSNYKDLIFRTMSTRSPHLYDQMRREYNAVMKAHLLQDGMYREDQLIPSGSNIDKRNTAMSVVASMMGASGVLANSSSMKVRVGDKLIEGTFMEAATGEDYCHITKDSLYLKAGPKTYDNPAFLKQLIELQALDYICMNIDRHCGNYFISYEKKRDGSVVATGLKGIDNDCSFGLKDTPEYFGENRMCGLGTMMVITQDMADRINNTTKEQFELSLKGLLASAEIDAAWQRMQAVKAEMAPADDPLDVRLNRIQIVDDKALSTLTLDKLADPLKPYFPKKQSIFALTKAMRTKAPRTKPQASSTKDPFTGAKNEVIGDEKVDYEAAAKRLRELSDNLIENNKGRFIGSRKYRAMNSYAMEAAETFEALANSGLPERDKNFIAGQVLQTLSEKTRAYLDSKLIDGSFAKNERSINRGLAAQELMEFTDRNVDLIDLRDDLQYNLVCTQEHKHIKKAIGLHGAGERIREINEMNTEHRIDEANKEDLAKELSSLYRFVVSVPGGIKSAGLSKQDMETSKAVLSEIVPKEEEVHLQEKKTLDVTEKSLMGDKLFQSVK